MPVTPFHFGPGAAFHAAAPKHVSFLAFFVANVLIDLESLHNLRAGNYPVHEFFHTYLGASLAIPATILLFLLARSLARVLPDAFGWKSVSVRAVGIGAAAGAYSHVVLDSIMHADMAPLAPFSTANALLGVLSLETLHWSCVGAGAIAVIVLIVRRNRTD
jgi:membrane-bound metal-dependent hydrolase YbcI (DUF457 family)